MSAHSLPDDLAHWPEDPNELLGVSFGVAPRELRRAYNHLIRTYKPEQFPEQFRRIREAYEYLLRIAEIFAPRAEAPDPPPAEEPHLLPTPKEQPSDDGAAEWMAESPRPAEEEPIAAQPRQPEEELDELWEAAIAGRPGDAYERLVQLTQQHAGRVELYLRLYWLRTLFPDVDGRCVPADWLVQGLLATGLAGPLHELYREEVADDSTEALSERYERLLDAPVRAGQLADLIEWRFQAAVRLKSWDILHADLSKLRPRFGLGEEQMWLRLVFSLADGVAWVGDPEGVRLLVACRDEIARHEHLASNMSYLFDRFDLLTTAAIDWMKLRLQNRIPGKFLRLIGVSWSRPFMEFRETLVEVLGIIAGSPQLWLDHLDEVRQLAPALLALFGELLDQFERTIEREMKQRDRDTARELVRPFLLCLNVDDYEVERTRLLLFCIREDVAPEEMAEAASIWEGALMADWSLRYVCRACRLFWA